MRNCIPPTVFWLGLIVLAGPARADVDLAELFAKTSPSVVTLTTFNAAGKKLGQGSGFIVDQAGVVATCLHVVGDASIVQVQEGNDNIRVASAIISSDKDWDIALLKIEPVQVPALKLASADELRIGASVIAIGSPLGLGNTLSQGIISGLRPYLSDRNLVQVTTPISPGSSGGPIVLAQTGEVIAMTASTNSSGQNLNFAIPADIIAREVKAVSQSVERKLGDFSPEIKQALVDEKKFRTAAELECTEADAAIINTTIEEAIASGAKIYNDGDPLGCFRVYEGAAYKILFLLGDRAPTVTQIFKTALKKADAVDEAKAGSALAAASAKAWIMRGAFDAIHGLVGRKPVKATSIKQ